MHRPLSATPARALAAGLAALSLAAGCSTEKTPPPDTTRAAAAPAPGAGTATGADTTARRLGVLGQMKTPESVRYDPAADVYYISNINGNPSQHDGNGFIVRVPADSTTTMTVLAQGGKNGVKLDAPKGIALAGNQLWVADIDVVRVLDKTTGRPIKTVDLRPMKATFLNDVALGPDSAIYVTDTGIMFDAKGAVTHPGTDRIFRIGLADGKVTEAAKDTALASPNGITWDAANARFVLAPFGGKNVQTWKPGSAPATLATGPGTYDGVEVLADGRILVTSWADSTVNVVRGSKLSKLITGVSGPADIGVDTKRMVVAVPRFDQNQVEFYKIP